MIKVLSIGNSFSEDAHRYLHQIAKTAGENIRCVNLFIGGCTLATHYKNINNDDRAYVIYFNGERTEFKTSVREALQADEWDVVTMQQQSGRSAVYETFQPYLNALSEYVRLHSPHAKQALHQTWAFENDSSNLINDGYSDSNAMFERIKNSYNAARNDINADFIIPCGEVLQQLSNLGLKVHHDTKHAGRGLGRLALALTWYEMLTEKSCEDIVFDDFEEPITQEEYELAKQISHKTACEYLLLKK